MLSSFGWGGNGAGGDAGDNGLANVNFSFFFVSFFPVGAGGGAGCIVHILSLKRQKDSGAVTN